MNQIWVESRGVGQLLPADAAAVGLDDRGFAYGDGLFETIRLRGGAPLFFARHMARLRNGLAQLGFPPLRWDEAALFERCCRVIAANALTDGVLKVILTRGAGPRGFEPPAESHPALFIQANSPPLSAKRTGEGPGVGAVLAPWKIDPASPLCRVKHLGALDKVLARQFAQQHGADETLFQNMDGQLTEAAASNLFLVVGGAIFTPALHCGLLPGIARGLLIETADALPVSIIETEIPVNRLSQADEAFLTNVVAGVRPLVRVNDRPIGSGGPGPITRGVQKLFEQIQNGGCNAC
ncbi:MAG: aminotransferase class IV [Chloroflexota bacterium]